MRILHLLSQTELTGAEVYAKSLIDYQHTHGFAVFVISDKIHVDLPVKWGSLPLSTSKRFLRYQNILKLRAFIKKNQIDVIHCHSRGAVRHGFWARAFLKTTMVTTLHGRQHPSLSKRLMNIYGEILIAVCAHVKTATVKDFSIHPDRIQVLPNPVSAGDTKAKPTPYSLALVGRSSGPKGRRFELLAKIAFPKWLEKLPDLKIDIIVTSPDGFSNGFLSFIEDLNTRHNQRIQLLSHISRLSDHLPNYELVIASGRIAVEAIQQKVSLLAFGEYHQFGIVTENNWQAVVDSNFGDMGDSQLEQPLDAEQVYKEVLNFYSNQDSFSKSKDFLHQKSRAYFSTSRVNEQILEIYHRARFKRHHPQWIPVLMYHKIPDQDIQSQHRIFVKKDNFEKHLRYFQKRKFTTLTLKDISSYLYGKKELSGFPKKPLVLTFDDGYKDNLTNAQPLLQKYQMKASIFLLANHDILENTWDTQLGDTKSEIMSLSEKKQLDLNTWEVGSHGFDHLKLSEVSFELAAKEIYQSKDKLNTDFNQEISSFAYPFGVRNDIVAEIVHEAKYQIAVNTDQGGLHIADNPYSVFRVNIFPEDDEFALWKKTSSWYRKYFYRKRKR